MKFSAVILAGGLSRRMGRDKAWIDFGGRTLLARQIDSVRSLGPVEVFVSGRSDTDYASCGCPVLLDPMADAGPLAGILAALLHSSVSHVLVLAVDLPLMTTEFLGELLEFSSPTAGVVPRSRHLVEPLAAVYPSQASVIIQQMFRNNLRAARAFAENCRREGLVRMHTVHERFWPCFANWNTPDDMGQHAFNLLRTPSKACPEPVQSGVGPDAPALRTFRPPGKRSSLLGKRLRSSRHPRS